MKTLLAAAVLALCAPAFAAEMTKEEALNIVEMEGDWPRCELGTEYDGGPALSEAEIKTACERYEAAKNRLLALGIAE